MPVRAPQTAIAAVRSRVQRDLPVGATFSGISEVAPPCALGPTSAGSVAYVAAATNAAVMPTTPTRIHASIRTVVRSCSDAKTSVGDATRFGIT